jgi:hypothetical protein
MTLTTILELVGIRERLFDALVLKKFEQKIEDKIGRIGGTFLSSSCKTLGKDLDWSIAKGYLNLNQLLAVSSSQPGGTFHGSTENGRNQKEFVAPNGDQQMNNSPTKKIDWRDDLNLYKEKKAIVFADRNERSKVLTALWHDPDLVGMPRDYAGGLILVVPERAVSLLRDKGFTFDVQDVAWN